MANLGKNPDGMMVLLPWLLKFGTFYNFLFLTLLKQMLVILGTVYIIHDIIHLFCSKINCFENGQF